MPGIKELGAGLRSNLVSDNLIFPLMVINLFIKKL
jgi:hypothetical protein